MHGLNGGAFGGPPIPWDIALNLGDYKLQAARALGIEVPSGVLSIADEVIEYAIICCAALWSLMAHRVTSLLRINRSLSGVKRTWRSLGEIGRTEAIRR
jgi:hypothetical protein